MKKLLIVALALGIAAGGVLGQTAKKKAAEKGGGGTFAQVITQLNKEFEAAANAKDAAKIGPMYIEDAVLMPPNGAAVRGRADIQKFWQGMIDQGARDVKVATVASASSGAVGYEAGTYEFTMGPAVGEAIHDKGKYLVGWKRGADGKWRLAYDIFNSDLPCPPATK